MSPVDQFAASLAEAREPLVLALDVPSTATRGATYDATGRPAGKRAKLAHAFTTYTDGTSQIHRDQVYDEVELSCYSSSTRQSFNNAPGRGAHQLPRSPPAVAAGGAIGAGSASVQVGVAGRVRPAAAARHDRRGNSDRRVDRAARPQNRAVGRRHARGVGRRPEAVLPVQDPGIPSDGVDPARVARRWPALASAAWFPALADGLSSNLGTGAADASTAAARSSDERRRACSRGRIPESIPTGLWCYRVDTGRSLLRGAFNDVGRLVAWLRSTLRLADDAPRSMRFLPANLIARVRRSGRITQSLPHLLQLIADAADTPVAHVAMKRATLCGSALLALETLAPDVERADTPVAGDVPPSSGPPGRTT